MADIKNGNFKESLYVQRKSRLRNGDSLIRLFSPYIFKYKTTNDISLTEPTPNKAWHKAIANTTGNSTSCPKTLLTSQPTKKYKNMIEDPLMKSLLPTLVSIMLYTTCLKHEKKQKKLPWTKLSKRRIDYHHTTHNSATFSSLCNNVFQATLCIVLRGYIPLVKGSCNAIGVFHLMQLFQSRHSYVAKLPKSNRDGVTKF